MNYYDAPPDPPQNKPIEPKSLISGQLPGATEIRIGNNIKISGKNQQIIVTTTGGNVVIGATSDGRLALEATNTDGSKVGIGNIPGTTNLGLYSVDSSSHTTAILGKQADGSNSLKFFDSNNIGLAQFGKFADGTTALKVAQPDIEVGTATNAQLIFNSSQNVFKIAFSGTTTIAARASAGTTTTTVTHNLGFIPGVLAYQVYSGTYYPLPTSILRLDTGAIQQMIDVENITSTTIDFVIQISAVSTPTTSPTITIKYYLLQETAN